MPKLDAASLQARNILIALFVAVCILDGVLIVLARDIWAIARLLFTLALMVLTLRGQRWAKWLLILICGLSVFALVTLTLILRDQLSPLLIGGSLILAMLYSMAAMHLGTNSALKRYLAWKRQSP